MITCKCKIIAHLKIWLKIHEDFIKTYEVELGKEEALQTGRERKPQESWKILMCYRGYAYLIDFKFRKIS